MGTITARLVFSRFVGLVGLGTISVTFRITVEQSLSSPLPIRLDERIEKTGIKSQNRISADPISQPPAAKPAH